MTHRKLTELRSHLAAETDPTRRRVLELAAEALGAELEARGGMAGAVGAALVEYSSTAARLAAGEEKLSGFFVGKVRAALGGKGDPQEIRAEVLRQLAGGGS